MAHAPTTWVAPAADGRLEVFVVGTDHAGSQSLWHRGQTAPGSGWSGWFSHGTPDGSNGLHWSPTVACDADGRLEVFVVGDDLQPGGTGSGGALYHQSQSAPDNGWTVWRSYPTGGPSLFGSPAIALNADGRLELFVLGDDGALWHIWQTAANNGWSQWSSHGAPLGVALNSAPAAAVGADGCLDVFIVSQEAMLWHIRQTAPNNGWSDWVSLGTPSGASFGSDSTPAVAPSADGRLELFVVGNDETLWHTRQTAPNGGWSDWASHDAPFGTKLQRLRPAVGSAADGRLELFAVSEDAALWHLRQTTPNGGWAQWFSHGAPPVPGLAGSPAAVQGPDGRLELFVVGTDGALWQLSQTAPEGGESQWFSHGAPPAVSLLAAITTG